MKNNPTFLPTLSLLLAMALWASSFIALKIAFVHYDPIFVIFGRMFIASICFLFFIKRFSRVIYHRGDWKYIVFMAASEPCLYFVFEAKALVNTTASQAGMITAMLPLMVAVGAHFFLKEKLTSRTVTGFVVAVCGACLLSAASDVTETAPNPMLGNFLEFMAMVCAMLYTISLKHLTWRYPPLFLTAIQAFIGAIFFFPGLFLPSTTLPDGWYPGAATAIFYLGTVITFGAYGLYNFGVSKIPASRASAYINLIPIFTIIMGALILDEKLTPVQYLASIMVFIGIYISHEKAGDASAKTPVAVTEG